MNKFSQQKENLPQVTTFNSNYKNLMINKIHFIINKLSKIKKELIDNDKNIDIILAQIGYNQQINNPYLVIINNQLQNKLNSFYINMDYLKEQQFKLQKQYDDLLSKL